MPDKLRKTASDLKLKGAFPDNTPGAQRRTSSARRPRKSYRLGDLSIHARELIPRCADQPNSRALSLAAFSARAAN